MTQTRVDEVLSGTPLHPGTLTRFQSAQYPLHDPGANPSPYPREEYPPPSAWYCTAFGILYSFDVQKVGRLDPGQLLPWPQTCMHQSEERRNKRQGIMAQTEAHDTPEVFEVESRPQWYSRATAFLALMSVFLSFFLSSFLSFFLSFFLSLSLSLSVSLFLVRSRCFQLASCDTLTHTPHPLLH